MPLGGELDNGLQIVHEVAVIQRVGARVTLAEMMLDPGIEQVRAIGVIDQRKSLEFGLGADFFRPPGLFPAHDDHLVLKNRLGQKIRVVRSVGNEADVQPARAQFPQDHLVGLVVHRQAQIRMLRL